MADCEPKDLFKSDEKTEFVDADRALMDDLKITKDSVSSQGYIISIFKDSYK